MPPGTLIDGRYRLGPLAGAGGMGSVHRAVDVVTGAEVAVKLPGARAPELPRFEAEAKALATLGHDDVVRLVGHGVDAEAGPYVVMEWVPGVTLREKLAAEGLAPEAALRLTARLVRALAAIHAAGVVHRDVKPSNVMLTASGPKLVDFGIARVSEGRGVTVTGALLGTPRYMAPEQIRSARGVDGRADVFALGCVLFEALVGRRPFEGGDEIALLARMLIEDARPPSRVRGELPAAVDALVLSLLARDPRKRPPASEALAREIEDLAERVAPSGLLPVRPLDPYADVVFGATEADEPVPASALGGFVEARAPRPAARAGVFLGREAELAAVLERTRAPGAVVSLWGALGMGKSRVALEAAREAWNARDVVYVDAEGARTPDVVAEKALAALGGARSGDAAQTSEAIARAMSARGTLLVLDGVEGVSADLGPLARTWLAGGDELPREPSGTVLLVARARAASADVAFEIGPLAEDVAARLYAARAAERAPLAPSAASEVAARIARAVSGSPLLLELAAARRDTLGDEGVATALERSSAELEGAATPGHGGTLGGTLRAIWQAEDEPSRAALACAAAFVAPRETGVIAAAASRLLGRDADALVASLRDRGLLMRVGATTEDDVPRFTVAPALRTFVHRADAELAARARDAIGPAVLDAAEAAARALEAQPRPAVRRALDAFAAELVAVAEHALEQAPRDVASALRALVVLDRTPGAGASAATHLALLERAQAGVAAGAAEVADARLRVEAAVMRGRLLALRRRDAEARDVLREATVAARALDPALAARALVELGVAHHVAGELAPAEESYEAVLALGEQIAVREELRALGNLGAIHHDRHDLDRAYARYVEAIALAETIPDERLLGVFLGNLAALERDRGRLDGARARYVRALAALEGAGDVRLSAMTLANLGLVELERGRVEDAVRDLVSARSGLARVGDVRSEALTLARLAAAQALAGEEIEAAKAAALARRMARGDAIVAGLLTLAEGCAAARRGDGDVVAATLAAADVALPDGRTLASASDDARALVRILRAW